MRLIFAPVAWADYLHWQEHDREMVSRINTLIRDMRRSPFSGLGKPEPLRGEFHGFWSRRITEEHRIVYRVGGKGTDQFLDLAQCRYHYRR